MKKLLIGGIVGGLILFIWQFLSWSMLNVHAANFTYTPNQQQVIDCLSANLTDGEYFIPGVPPDASSEEYAEYQKNAVGKPWAKVNYRSSFNVNMGMNMIRGFAMDFLAALMLCWILLKIPNVSFVDVLMSSLAVGLIGYFTGPYINNVWFETSSIGDLIDALVSWGLTGAFLGWWLRR